MFSTYTLNTDELTPQFIKTLRQTYPNKKIEIIVQEVMDETEILLEDQQLLKAVQDIKDGKNLIAVSLDSM
jgi:aryl carrier-like protein